MANAVLSLVRATQLNTRTYGGVVEPYDRHPFDGLRARADRLGRWLHRHRLWPKGTSSRSTAEPGQSRESQSSSSPEPDEFVPSLAARSSSMEPGETIQSRSSQCYPPLPPPSWIEMVPLDIFRCICDHLDDADIACLRYCNRKLQQLLQPSSRAPLYLRYCSYEARGETRRRLAKDCSHYFWCQSCKYLHRITIIRPAAAGDYKHFFRPGDVATISTNEYWRHLPEGMFRVCRDDTRYRLAFNHVQLCMARHRRGAPYGIDLDYLRALEVFEASLEDSIAVVQSFEPAIIDDQLYLRNQQYYLIPWGDASSVTRRIRTSFCSSLDREWSCILSDGMPKLLRCRWNHPTSKRSWRLCSPYLCCVGCAVEVHAVFGAAGVGKAALTITRWIPLGRGLSIEDKDRHGSWNQSCKPDFIASSGVIPGVHPTRERFEAHAAVNFQAHAEQLKELLVTRSYIDTFRHCTGKYRPHIWYQYGAEAVLGAA